LDLNLSYSGSWTNPKGAREGKGVEKRLLEEKRREEAKREII